MHADPITTLARRMLLSRRNVLRVWCADAVARTPVRGSRLPPHELEEVEAALERIEQGRFGCCERCGGAIGRQRLLAVPEARCCLACADARARDANA
ncbi:TraR/DksA family transcriptional regulator [Corallococcus exiguus]|uniref:TraR/DksA family transcriptional regulator n=1 Tax=Corallococcus exiguus TaxID=83462 RepID=UPI001F5EFB80|nr:TraR/DksA C4-type zinc finger protein [Corallococcus exiguus]